MIGATVGVWLGAGSPVGQPYPCRCHERRYSKCSARWCQCSGRTDLWWLPEQCCAHRNPAKLPQACWERATALPGAGTGVARPPAPLARPQHGGPARVSQGGSGGARATPETLEDLAEEWARSLRIFPPESLTCTCRTPWDGQKNRAGLHCSDCHSNFQNALCFEMHRKSALVECRDPGDICDVDTGEQLFGLTRVGGFPVWYWALFANRESRVVAGLRQRARSVVPPAAQRDPPGIASHPAVSGTRESHGRTLTT